MTKKKTYSTIVGGCWREKVVSVFGFGHSKYHFRAPENGHFWKRPQIFFFCIFGRHSYRYNIYQVRMEFRKLFDILVRPNGHEQLTALETTKRKDLHRHILTGCPWNHFFGCQSLKERFFRDTLYISCSFDLWACAASLGTQLRFKPPENKSGVPW